MENTDINEKAKKKKRKDIIFIALIIIVALAAYIIIDVVVKKEGSKVVVKVDGKVVDTMRLNKDQSIIVKGYDGGTNTVVIENNMVYMTEADCPDKICVNTGKISRVGETIVCLPHRVVVEITGSANDNADGSADKNNNQNASDNEPLDSVVR